MADLAREAEPSAAPEQATQKVTVTERNLKRYHEIFTAFQESIQTYCRTYGMNCTRATTDTPFDELILRMMRAAGAVS